MNKLLAVVPLKVTFKVIIKVPRRRIQGMVKEEIKMMSQIQTGVICMTLRGLLMWAETMLGQGPGTRDSREEENILPLHTLVLGGGMLPSDNAP